MRYVLDASAAAAWFFEDESAPVADLAFDLLENGATALTPMLFWFELRNAVQIGKRRDRILGNRATAVFVRLNRAAIEYDPLPVDDQTIFTLAQRHRLTFYDAAYLELAQREDIALATLDQALAKAAVAEGIALVGA